MGVAINILSAVLKSVVDNKIGNELANELIGISIDGISEKSINTINDYIDKEKSKINHILSKENMVSMNIPEENVDYVVAEIKHLLSKVKFTDEVFRQCKYESKKLGDYLWDEFRAYTDGYIECESDIKKGLFAVANALVKLMYESEQFEKDFLIRISNSIDDTNVEIQKISEYMKENFDKLDVNNQEILVILHSILKQLQNSNIQNKKQEVKSRTQEYADKWKSNMFLNDFDKRDKNPGVNVKLKDVYLESHLPHYIWKDNPEEEPSTDLKVLLSEYIDDNSGNKMLLILGQPGIGKSTLITWITANFISRVDDIMVYQFAADLNGIDWQKANISIEILDALNISYDDLNGKTLILDGLDEISVGDRKKILDKIYWELIKGRNIERFSLIITCRENYINSFERIQCKYITLLPWDEEQIESFRTLYQEKTKAIISKHTMARVIANKDIFGIPLILYMILALNISIEKEGSIVDIYDKIFSLEGGIYDRCIENKNFADNHKIVSEIKKQIHQISREIAIWMFENNPNEVFIPQKEYEKVCDNVIKAQAKENEFIKQDFLIGNFYKLRHCERVGTGEIYFVHRSIYEYFVAEAIYSSIKDALLEISEESKEQLAGNIAVYLKEGRITNTIGEYLQYMILKLYQSLNGEKKEIFYQWWESTVDMMMIFGMFYYTKRNIQDYKGIIYEEARCFVNLMIILRLLQKTSKNIYIMQNVDKAVIEVYVKLVLTQTRIKLEYFNFCKMSLSGLNLVGADLRGAYLREVDLREADLREADLREADLLKAYLVKANLLYANLYKADLTGANLMGAILIGANLEGANLTGVYLIGTELDDSFWLKSDVEEALPLLKQAYFHYLNVYDDGGKAKKIYRNELFPDEDNVLNA